MENEDREDTDPGSLRARIQLLEEELAADRAANKTNQEGTEKELERLRRLLESIDDTIKNP